MLFNSWFVNTLILILIPADHVCESWGLILLGHVNEKEITDSTSHCDLRVALFIGTANLL